MAVLSSPARRPASPVSVRVVVVLAALLLNVVGCVVVDAVGGQAQPLAFSHARHVEGEALDCSDCHLTFEDSDDPGMPTASQCMLCHEKIDKEKPPEKRIDQLFDGKTYRATNAAALSSEVVFSHQKHVSTPDKCGECHRGIDQSERITSAGTVTMDDCKSCHDRTGTAAECATCHREIRQDREPASHEHFWLRSHGKVVRSQACEDVADRCSLCHERSSCQNCHQNEPPTSHNNFFRRRGHGLMARLDRDNCAACHRQDSCTACHAQAQPANHTPSFGGTRNTHCVTCHLPLPANDCATCHQGTPSHALATPIPPNHNRGFNCRQCHGVGVRLPHADKGDACTTCHR